MMDTPPGMDGVETMLEILEQDEWWRHQTGDSHLAVGETPHFTWSRRTDLTLEHRASIIGYALRKAPDIVETYVRHLERLALSIPGDTDATADLYDRIVGEAERLGDMTTDQRVRHVANTAMVTALMGDVAAFLGFAIVRFDRLQALEDLEGALIAIGKAQHHE